MTLEEACNINAKLVAASLIRDGSMTADTPCLEDVSLADAITASEMVMRLGSRLADEINKRVAMHRAGMTGWAAA